MTELQNRRRGCDCIKHLIIALMFNSTSPTGQDLKCPNLSRSVPAHGKPSIMTRHKHCIKAEVN